jgi:hypothetical protein
MWQEVRKSIGDRRDLDTELKKAMNEATQDIAAMFRVRNVIQNGSFTTTEGVATYSLGDEVYDVINARNDTDDVPLFPGDQTEYDALPANDSDDYGTPNKWFVDGEDLIIYNAVPDDTNFDITYRYIYRLPDMVGDTTVFPLPREWERPAKLLAKSYMFELLGQSDKAIAAYQQAVAIGAARHNDKYFRDIHNQDARADFSSPYHSDQGF